MVRCHTCGISVGNPLSFETALGVFNSTATDHIDVAVAAAKANGIRLIVPLIDNWHYYHGGKHTFTDWLGLPSEDDFYTDARAIAAFKQYIGKLLNHTSNVTGIRYGSDPTVMIWETGNELHYMGGPPPVAWTEEIAAYIKSVSPDHLVMDGTESVNTAALNCSDVDVYSLHMYPGPNVAEAAQQAAEVAKAGKAFLVGEFGWKTDTLNPFLAMVESNSAVSADLYWSLFPHRNDHGFVQHGHGFSLHYPNGDGDEDAVTSLRKHAWAMQGKSPAPGDPSPTVPLLTLIADGPAGIAWRGAAGANKYIVQAGPAAAGPWTTVCAECADDTQTPIPMPPAWSQSSFFRVAGVAPDNTTQGPWSAPATNSSL